MTTDDPAAAAETAPVQAADRALHILELLADNGPMTIGVIARELDVHRTTAFRLLGTLEARRFVVQSSPRGTYSLGVGALRIAGSAVARIDIAREAQLMCDEVTAVLHETSNIAILDQGAAVNIAQSTGTSSVAVRDQYVGQRTPLHATSSGKVLLAFAGPSDGAPPPPPQRFTESTITDSAALADELMQIRERQWGAALGEWQEHTNAVAVPVFGEDGSVLAAISVTAPAFRMPETALPGLAEQLRDFSRQFSRRLGHRVPLPE